MTIRVPLESTINESETKDRNGVIHYENVQNKRQGFKVINFQSINVAVNNALFLVPKIGVTILANQIVLIQHYVTMLS